MNENQLKLSPRVAEIVAYYFQNPLLKQAELAKVFNVSVQRINAILNSEKVLKIYPVLAKRKVRSLVPKAVQRLETLMEQNENMAVSEKIVGKILDQEEILKPQPQIVIHELRMKTTEELQAIVEEGKKLSGPVIDAEIVE